MPAPSRDSPWSRDKNPDSWSHFKDLALPPSPGLLCTALPTSCIGSPLLGLLSLELIPKQRPCHDLFRRRPAYPSGLREIQLLVYWSPNHTAARFLHHTHVHIFLLSSHLLEPWTPCQWLAEGKACGTILANQVWGVVWGFWEGSLAPRCRSGTCFFRPILSHQGWQQGLQQRSQSLGVGGCPRTGLTLWAWKDRKTEATTSCDLDGPLDQPTWNQLIFQILIRWLSFCCCQRHFGPWIFLWLLLLLATKSGINYTGTQLRCHTPERILWDISNLILHPLTWPLSTNSTLFILHWIYCLWYCIYVHSVYSISILLMVYYLHCSYCLYHMACTISVTLGCSVLYFKFYFSISITLWMLLVVYLFFISVLHLKVICLRSWTYLL